MEKYKGLIIIIMLLCIVVIFIGLKIEQYKLNLKEIEQYKLFKGRKKITFNEVRNDKGVYGEFKTFKVFNNYFGENSIIFNSLYLPKENRKFTEVDLIAITEKCIFIVEVKNLYGIVTGNKEEKYWTQKLSNSTNEEIYNPIIQNENHIKYFKRNVDLLKYNLSNKNIYSLIVFGNKSDIKEVRYNEENIKVVNINELETTLSEIMNNNSTILKQDQIKEIGEILKKFEDIDSTKREKHINDILEYN
ncbi:nuclease-related domain-containing protein [Paraclostridium bifermentans]|uniref:nuclease-related domain-containing protein n=1 Tax=Paraclostridium bifermentans TaxID=1490 RepID=UPI00189B7528|nr:nuclease-related domain-containing protein [Paraclostridium bifermentans]